MHLSGKRIVVTGGTDGIGAALARLLVEREAQVIVTGRTPATVEASQKELGPLARAVVADTSNLTDLDRVVDLAKTHLGHVDFVFVNAGIAKFAPFDATDEKLWDEQHDINIGT